MLMDVFFHCSQWGSLARFTYIGKFPFRSLWLFWMHYVMFWYEECMLC